MKTSLDRETWRPIIIERDHTREWTTAYCAAMRAGKTLDEACAAADRLVNELEVRFKRGVGVETK